MLLGLRQQLQETMDAVTDIGITLLPDLAQERTYIMGAQWRLWLYQLADEMVCSVVYIHPILSSTETFEYDDGANWSSHENHLAVVWHWGDALCQFAGLQDYLVGALASTVIITGAVVPLYIEWNFIFDHVKHFVEMRSCSGSGNGHDSSYWLLLDLLRGLTVLHF
jgi:hypothetical protein